MPTYPIAPLSFKTQPIPHRKHFSPQTYPFPCHPAIPSPKNPPSYTLQTSSLPFHECRSCKQQISINQVSAHLPTTIPPIISNHPASTLERAPSIRAGPGIQSSEPRLADDWLGLCASLHVQRSSSGYHGSGCADGLCVPSLIR